MSERGVECGPDEVFITNGAQQGLAILSRLFLDPGQVAVTEEVTFTGVQQVTRGRGAELRPVAIDPHTGVDLQALEAALASKPQPSLAVLIPTFHNPISATIPESVRGEAAGLAAKYGVPLVEDDPYFELRFEGVAVPPIKAFDDAGFVFYLGSFSKVLAPAVRLGWIVAPKELIGRITVLRESLDLESSTLIQRAVFRFINGDECERHLSRVRNLLRERRVAMLGALEKHLAGAGEWTCPEGGLFIWLTLPAGIDTWELFEKSISQQVAYIPGSAFAVTGSHRNTIRLSFGNVTPEKIDEGIRRLSSVLAEAGERSAAIT
jgi:2-aminoadipate transaminase